ncbi:MAG: zinc-binding alcohol dehydrogenase [Pseudomonadota bacterium]
MRADTLWSTAQGVMEIREEEVTRSETGVLLRTLYSGVSRGTEATVLAGRVPPDLADAMRVPHQGGAFPFPVKYGYSLVGEVSDGPPDMRGKMAFALHPHQTQAALDRAAVHLLPDTLPPRRAVLTANTETALTVAWDAGAGPGDRVLVIGAGVVGLLVARVLRDLPGAEVTLLDQNLARSGVAARLGLALTDIAPSDVDIAINASGSAAGLQRAIDAAGQEATVVEASWHGAGTQPLALGGAFHPRRLTLRSSQVGRIPPGRAPRWTHARRLATALNVLAEWPEVDALLGPEIAFPDAPRILPPLLAPGADALCPILTYETGD